MRKAEFVELMQNNGNFKSKSAAERAIKAFTDSITQMLVKKESLTLIDFGTFSTVHVAAKSGTVPGTDKTYNKPAHTAPKFKFSKTVKDAVN